MGEVVIEGEAVESGAAEGEAVIVESPSDVPAEAPAADAVPEAPVEEGATDAVPEAPAEEAAAEDASA